MGLPQPNGYLDPDAFLEWEKTQLEKYEYLDGQVVQVYAMVGARRACHGGAQCGEPAPGTSARRAVPYLHQRYEAQSRGGQRLLLSRVFVTCDPRDRPEDTYKRFPLLVVEVLSDSTAGYDRGRKFAVYRQVESLQEYAIIDPDTFTVDCFRRDESGHWVLYAFAGEDTVEFRSVDFKAPLSSVFEDVEAREVTGL